RPYRGSRHAAGPPARPHVAGLGRPPCPGDADLIEGSPSRAARPRLLSPAGGLADWFAVTALFRRPLGLPIPHTAIVVERKDRFADTLGAFVQESFLTPAAVSERLRASRAVERVA